MPTTTKTRIVTLRGMLRSEDGKLKRGCKVRAEIHEMFVHERDEPVKVEYSKPAIADSDDWPDGDYYATYAEREQSFTKSGGQYRSTVKPRL